MANVARHCIISSISVKERGPREAPLFFCALSEAPLPETPFRAFPA